MQQIPNISSSDIQKLDEKISISCTKGNKIDKAKKDLFKKITSQLIGRNIGQLFRKEVKIMNLPSLADGSVTHNSSHFDIIESTQESGLPQLFSTRS